MSKITIQKTKEYLALLFLNIKVRCGNILDYLIVFVNYYSNFEFFKIDNYLLFSYLFNNPFGISKRFLIKQGAEDIYTYGETPLRTLEAISKECRISPKDVVFELGCGRGRTCFWLNQFIGCSVVGIDFVPEFIKRANEVKEKFGLTQVYFREEDFLDSDLTGATVVYLYGTSYSDVLIRKLVKKFSKLPRGTKFITVSYSLSMYSDYPIFEVMKRFPAKFTWGEGDVYLEIKK